MKLARAYSSKTGRNKAAFAAFITAAAALAGSMLARKTGLPEDATIAVSAGCLTGLITLIRNWLKNRDRAKWQ